MTTASAKAIRVAREAIAKHDLYLAVYAVRDLPETEAAGLRELAWAMHDGYCTEAEVTDLVDRVEAWAEQPQGDGQWGEVTGDDNLAATADRNAGTQPAGGVGHADANLWPHRVRPRTTVSRD